MPASFARSVGLGGISMSLYSQIANFEARNKIHRLHNASKRLPSQNAKMETEKNGGLNYLQAWREFRRMSREALAERVGTTGAVIWHLEQGERALSAKWLRRLAPALETTPGLLLDHDPEDLPSDVFEIWLAADKIQRQQISALAKTMVDFKVSTGTDG